MRRTSSPRLGERSSGRWWRAWSAPDEQPDRERAADIAAPRLRIEYLATAAAWRRRGIGTRLVQAAEAWGRTFGATVAETTTFQGSPLSVPFWEDRMGYEELSINLRKRL